MIKSVGPSIQEAEEDPQYPYYTSKGGIIVDSGYPHGGQEDRHLNEIRTRRGGREEGGGS